MSEEISTHISNSQALLDKMFSYIEFLEKAIEVIKNQIENSKI